MNTKTKLGIGMLFVIMACMIVLPASALSGTVAVYSTVPESFGMTIAPGDITFPLIIGTTEKTDGNLVTITSNTKHYIKARANTANGCMQEFKAGTGGGLQSNFLANPLQVSINSVYVPLTGTDQLIHEGDFGYASNLKLKQFVQPTDESVTAPNNYQMIITITGTATP